MSTPVTQRVRSLGAGAPLPVRTILSRAVAPEAASVDAPAFAHAPSPLARVFRDLEAELHVPEPSPVQVARCCGRLVLDLELHFDAEETRGPLTALRRVQPAAAEAVAECCRQHESLLADAKRLLRDANHPRYTPARQRRVNRAYAKLREGFNAQQRVEMQLIQHAYGLDVRESD